MRLFRFFSCLGLLVVLASNTWSMSRWNESRGVYDDICYLRQAHLFQKYGRWSLDTNITRDDDHYLSRKLKEIGFPTWSDVRTAPCHTPMPATKKLVIQYPPGTGFVLALFPEGYQVVPLYIAASIVLVALGLVAIFRASTPASLALTMVFADLAVYLMINPAKASYSMAPTMVVCGLAGYLTARVFLAEQLRHRLVLTAVIGLLIGLSVNFRLPNLLLSSGYFLFFLFSFIAARKIAVLVQGGLFGAAFLAGGAPTLIANAVNAGSPFRTTYGGVDVTPPDFSFSIIWQYAADMQFVLLLFSIGGTIWMLRVRRGDGARQVTLVIGANLLVNLGFFMSHPVFTPYYTIPVAMLSLWSLLFAFLLQPMEAVDRGLAGQAARA